MFLVFFFHYQFEISEQNSTCKDILGKIEIPRLALYTNTLHRIDVNVKESLNCVMVWIYAR